MRVAVAASPELKAKQGFIATVAENRGAIIQIFDSVEEALAWLTGESNNSIEATPDGASHG